MGTLFKRSRYGKASNWYAEYTDETGERRQRSTGTRDKRTASDILASWELEATKIRAGLADPDAERIREQHLRPIADHLREYVQSFRSSHKSDTHIEKTENRINAIIEYCGWRSWRDCRPEDLERFAVSLRENKSIGSGKGAAPATVGHYMQAVKGFSKWALKTKRIPVDPLWTVSKPNPESDRRLKRRMILPTEWPWLMRAIQSPSFGMPALDRRVLYEFAVQTALRSNEIRTRTVSKLDFSRNAVQIEGAATKNRKPGWLHFTPQFGRTLTVFCHGKQQADPLFELCNPTNMARMLQKDVETAREMWIMEAKTDREKEDRQKTDFLAITNAAGESIDFHSLRHTCGAWLAIRGVHPKTIQSVMRHSTIKLTLDTYGHLMPGAEPEAIAKLSDIFTSQ